MSQTTGLLKEIVKKVFIMEYFYVDLFISLKMLKKFKK